MKIKDPLRAKLNLILAAALAFAFGLGLAAALDLTPLTFAADERDAPQLVIGNPDAPDVTLNGGFADVVEEITPAVVTVFVEGRPRRVAQRPFRLPPGFEDFFGDPRGERRPDPEDELLPRGSGSGFIISEDGYVLTNNHVVEGATRVDLQLADQRRFQDVEVVGRDPQTDVALLRIPDVSGLPVAPLGSADRTRVGEWVLAIGSPGFSGGPGTLETTVTAGIVSAKGRNINILAARTQLAIEDFIQTDAVINRGNSGGPLVNARGEVVGINSAIASETGFYQGYGFAVPIELAREVVDDLIEYGEVRRAVIGVLIGPVTSADAKYYGLDRVGGAKVQNFSSEDSPAREAGMQRGDVIVGVEGQPVTSVSDVQRRIREYEPGDRVQIQVVRRNGERESVTVRLAPAETEQRPEQRLAAGEREADALGIQQVQELTAGVRERLDVAPDVEGVLVTDAVAQGPLGRTLGIDPDAIVVGDVNGEPVRSVEEYEEAVSRLQSGDVANLLLYIPGPQGPGGQRSWVPQVVSVEIPQ